MITDEEIDVISTQYVGLGGVEDYRAFARAIYQLGRQHQRERDAELCESNEYATGKINENGETRYLLPSEVYRDGTGMWHPGMTYACEIRKNKDE